MDAVDVADDNNSTSSSVSVSANVISVAEAENLLPPEKEHPDTDGLEEKQDSGSIRENDSPNPSLECPVCLQPCIHPVQLPCSHVFCFLCVKGVANRSKRCALCRQEIPLSYFHNPKLVRQDELLKNAAFEDGYQWFYKGRNGWWQYDERTSYELEEKYKKEEKTFELLIAGFLYVIDLDSMQQCRRNDPTRRRRIKRDLESIPEKKGVAGLHTMTGTNNPRQGAYGLETAGTAVKTSGQLSHASDGQACGQGDHISTSVTPVTCPVSPSSTVCVPSNSPHNSHSPSDPTTADVSLTSAVGNLHINHAGDGRNTSPEPRPQRTGRQRSPMPINRRSGSLSSLSDDQSPVPPRLMPPNGPSHTAETHAHVAASDGQAVTSIGHGTGMTSQTSQTDRQFVSQQDFQNGPPIARPPDRVHQRTSRRQATEGHSDPQQAPGITVRNSQSSSRVTSTSPSRPAPASGSTSDSHVNRTGNQATPGDVRRAPRGAPRDQRD